MSLRLGSARSLPKPPSGCLGEWKRRHGVATYVAKRWTLPLPCVAFFVYPAGDPLRRSFTVLSATYGWEECYRRGAVCAGADALSACRALAIRNGLPLPA